MLILSLISIFKIIVLNDSTDQLHIVLSIIYLLTIIVVVIRRFLKPRLLQFESIVLIINNNRIVASNIKQIYIDGNHIIGINLKKTRIVPIALCFKFINNQSGINTLVEWAKNNNIEVSHKTFMKWI